MYITVTKQTLDGNFTQSVSDFVAYLEKENEGKSIDEMEHFLTNMAKKYQERKSSKKSTEIPLNSKRPNLNFIPLRSIRVPMN